MIKETLNFGVLVAYLTLAGAGLILSSRWAKL